MPKSAGFQKAVSQKRGCRKAVVSKQGRQVAGVVGVFTILWVIVGHGVGERLVAIIIAVGSLMDMESENPLMAGLAG